MIIKEGEARMVIPNRLPICTIGAGSREMPVVQSLRPYSVGLYYLNAIGLPYVCFLFNFAAWKDPVGKWDFV